MFETGPGLKSRANERSWSEQVKPPNTKVVDILKSVKVWSETKRRPTSERTKEGSVGSVLERTSANQRQCDIILAVQAGLPF